MRAFEEKYNVPIVQAWGMTETSPLATVARPAHRADATRRWEMRIPGPADLRCRNPVAG